MITETDSLNTIELDKYYVICPSTPIWSMDDYINAFKGRKVPYGFEYNSGTNDEWLTVDDLRQQIKQHVDPTFEV